MSAFDEPRGGAGGGRSAPSSRTGMARVTGGSPRVVSGGGAARAAGGGGFDSAPVRASGPMSTGGAVSYQSGDRLYTSTCENIERELRKLTSTVVAAKKQVAVVGTAKDTEDVRKKLNANLENAKDSVKTISGLLKSELAAAVEAADLSGREKNDRKMQQTRYQKDFKDAMQAFQDVANSASDAQRKHPKPVGVTGTSVDASQTSGGAGAGGAGGGKGKKGAAAATSREDDALLSRMQQVDFDAAVVEERDEAINDIASAIMEVNETMRDLANLVEEQGKDIEQIEVNVTEAEDNTAKGVEHLTQAEKYQKGYRKWIIIMLVIIVAAAGGIGAYFALSNSKKS